MTYRVNESKQKKLIRVEHKPGLTVIKNIKTFLHKYCKSIQHTSSKWNWREPHPNYLNMKVGLHTASKPNLLSSAPTQNQKTGSTQHATPYWQHPTKPCSRVSAWFFGVFNALWSIFKQPPKVYVWTSAENLSFHCHHCGQVTWEARTFPATCWKASQLCTSNAPGSIQRRAQINKTGI